MRHLAALLILAAVARADDAKAGFEWAEGLEAALRKAGAENRLVLLRQVHCDCDGTKCPALESARRSAWLDRASTKKRVDLGFVPALAHAPKDRDVLGLFHPTFLPAEFRRDPSKVRTLIVTPTGHVIHRLDLCPDADDADAELEFAKSARSECFTASWIPVPEWEERLRGLHALHVMTPERWHRKLRAAVKGDPPKDAWKGYANLEIDWQPDLEAAKEAAWESNRLVFYYQVVGNLDREGC